MSLAKALEQEDNIELLLDNAELSLEEPDSLIFNDEDLRNKVIERLLVCASDNGQLSLLKRIFDFFVSLKSVNLLSSSTDYKRLRSGLLYKRTTLPNKKKEIVNNFLQFLDEQIPQPDVLDYQPFIPLNQLLNGGEEGPEEDKVFLDVLKKYIADQPEEVQVHYLSSLAPPDLVDSLKIPCQLLAEKLTFANGARKKFTIMVMGKTGQGKSCLVNELHRLSAEERCPEFAGKSTGTLDLESKTVTYKRPLKPEEVPTQPPPSPSLSSIPTTTTATTSTIVPPSSPAPAVAPATPVEEQPLLEEKDKKEDKEDKEDDEDLVGVDVQIIDTPGIEAKSERQEQVQGEIFERLSEGFVEGGSPVHVILHCLNPSVPRLDDIEHEWIRAVSGYVPVVLVYTHALTSPEDIKSWIDKLSPPLPIVTDVQVLARDEETGARKKTLIKRFGMVELVDALVGVYPQSLAMIEEHIQESNATSEEQLLKKRQSAYSVVAGAAAGGGVSGALPVPGADIAATIAVQGFMLAGINKVYGIPYDKSLLATLGSQLVWCAPATLLSRGALAIIASSLKVIPFVDIAASFINAGLGIFFTAALGMAYVETLDKLIRTRGNLIGLPKAERQRLIEEMFKEEAKKVAAEDMKTIKQKLDEETRE